MERLAILLLKAFRVAPMSFFLEPNQIVLKFMAYTLYSLSEILRLTLPVHISIAIRPKKFRLFVIRPKKIQLYGYFLVYFELTLPF